MKNNNRLVCSSNLKDLIHRSALEKEAAITRLQGECEQLNDFLQEVSKENEAHVGQIARLKEQLETTTEALLSKNSELSTAGTSSARLKECEHELASAIQDLEAAKQKVCIPCFFFFVCFRATDVND